MNTIRSRRLTSATVAMLFSASALAFTPSQQPPTTSAVPGNVMLALSVEFPTGLQVSYTNTTYDSATTYDGYFDNRKCYTYSTSAELFSPGGAISSTGTCSDSDEWSGNLLNWLTMTNLDQFRSVMTGGTRDDFSAKATSSSSYHGDTTTRTILIRSFSDRNSYNPNKTLPSGGSAPLPSDYRGKTVRSGGYGSKFIVSDSGFSDMSGTQQRQRCSDHSGINRLGCFNIRVSACVASPARGVTGNVREANCQAKYSGVAKPEGLIQEYASTLRFGAFGYLNHTANDRNGGVLRSAMKSVGPVKATSTGTTTNANVEWNTTTGVMIPNPDPTDATASGVSNSGLMNYLNKFGYAAGYKGNDPVSELYYAALLYMRGYAPPAEYTSGLTTAYKDGFPVITGSDHLRAGSRDPMINTCQRSFVLAIGDIYTHCDGNLPGSTKNGSCPQTASLTSTSSDPDNLNVETLWDTLIGQEGIPDARDASGNNGWAGGSGTPTPYVAGLAHWAHTNDIRSDLTGTQSISTYFVDVIENGNGVGGMPDAAQLRSQYWLAAKYGGFDNDPETTNATGNNPNVKVDATQPYAWDKDGNGVPDTWYAGSTPSLLRSGLQSAFNDINIQAGAAAASSAAVTSSRQTSSSQIIYAGYSPKTWTGNVRACTPSQTATECETTPTWDAADWLHRTSTAVPAADKLTASTRKIITSYRSGATFSKSRFQWASLPSAQQTLLNADSNGSARVDFLRGDRSQEGILFRTRPDGLLSDVVNSGVTYVASAGPAYVGSNFPGHATYRTSTRTRPPVVYVGANDGMLHAFSGANGKELFAYIPGSVFANLPSLSSPGFVHKYFVDGTPMVGDFEKTGSTAASPSWGTILVGGLGAGGKGYYALDISSQSSFETSDEATLASALPMWEFTSAQDSDLGYTFNEPSINPSNGAYRQIAKVADPTTATGEWRVIVGNGYGSTGGDAVLFMLNANTGAVSTKLATSTNATPNGLSAPTPFDSDRDGLIDTIYAGDYLGNLHKFQFVKANGTEWVLAKPAEAGSQWRYLGTVYASGEPITTAPSVLPACDGAGLNVLFGTGKLNEDTDYSDTSSRGFYSVVDKNPSSSLTVPSTDIATVASFATTTLSDGTIGRNWTTPNMAGKRGWKVAFANGERVLTNSTLPPDTGAVLFATTKPEGDVCTPGNSGFLMAVNICSGATGGIIYAGTAVGGVAIDSSGIVKVSNTYTDSENKQIVVCNQDDCKDPPPCTAAEIAANDPKCKKTNLAGNIAPRGRYSWREILSK